MTLPLALACLGLGLLCGCEKLLAIQDPVPGVLDGRSAGDGSVDGGLPPSSPLLLSEVVLAPSPGEMIEIVNTSSEEVDLSTYYLTDSGGYYTLPVQASVQTSDFIVKFPIGAKLAGHKVLVVAIGMPADFAATYGRAPSFSVVDGSMQTIAMNGQPTLTNEGEPVILFQWDGRSDLVRDVDIMLVGIPTGMFNAFPSKSGSQQDGPDADMIPSAYAVDRHTISAQLSAPGPGLSTKRIQLEAGHEVQDGTGNGQSGDDETSEDTSVTWDTAFTPPDPFTVDLPQ
jgi:hypothetical protein